MRILILSHMYPNPANPISGVFVHQQAKALVAAGHDVRVISPLPWMPKAGALFSKRAKKYANIPAMHSIDDIKVYFPRYRVLPRHLLFERSGDWYYDSIKDIVAQLYKEWPFDIIHAHVALPDGYAGLRIKRDCSKPLVLSIHGQDINYTIHRNAACKDMVVEALKGADAIVTVSGVLKRSLSELTDENKVYVIHNGVEVDTAGNCESIRKRYSGKKIILSVGNLLKSKGQHTVIRALKGIIKDYKDIVYIIVGKGPYREELESLVKQQELEQYVEFIGQLPHDEAMRYMKACDIFALPSYPEGFGIVFVEAMACSKPVIACKNTGIEDIIRDGENGILVKYDDVVAVSEAMRRLLANEDYAAEMGKRAVSSVSDLTWYNNALQLSELYERLGSR